jgi:hypothetical protein
VLYRCGSIAGCEDGSDDGIMEQWRCTSSVRDAVFLQEIGLAMTDDGDEYMEYCYPWGDLPAVAIVAAGYSISEV